MHYFAVFLRFSLDFRFYPLLYSLLFNKKDGRQAHIVYMQRIVIVGAGIVGLSTAYALLKQGMKHVTVLEQAAVDHRRGTSHGLSRLLRFEYGPDLLYSEMVQRSLQHWRMLERISQRLLYTPTNLLVLGNEGDNFTQPSYQILREMGLPVERLSRQTCKQRYPQFDTHDYTMFTQNTEAGILHASHCLQTLKDLILDLGGTICEAQQVTHINFDSAHAPIRLFFSDATSIQADRVVLAVGPWVHHLLGDIYLPIRITRQYLLYYAKLPVHSFGLHNFPAFLSEELYGFPIHSTCGYGPGWLKVASHTFGATIDPDDVPRIDQRVIADIEHSVYDLLPMLRHAELAHIDTCMYDVSPDEGFILDYLPYNPRVVFATGLTGHGFKFGPLLGELLSSLVRNTPPPVPMERFQLSRFASHHQHQTSSVA